MKEWVGKRKKECEAIIHESESSPLAVMEANMQLPLIAEIERLEKKVKYEQELKFEFARKCIRRSRQQKQLIAKIEKYDAVVDAAKAYIDWRLSCYNQRPYGIAPPLNKFEKELQQALRAAGEERR